MKYLKMKNVLAIFLMAFTMTAFGQEELKPAPRADRADRGAKLSVEERVDKRIEKMTKQLDLSADQQKELREVLLAQKEQKEVMKEQKDAMKAQRKVIREQEMEKVKSVLTSEQLEKMETLQKERAKKRKMRRDRKGNK